MNRLKYTVLWCAALLVLAGTPARAQQSPQARIADMTMALGADDLTKEPIERTDGYTMWSNSFTCCVDVSGVFEPTLVTSIWYYINPDENILIDSTVIRVSQDTWVAFTLAHGGAGWPYGDYFIEVYMDGEMVKALPFSVEPTYPGQVVSEIVLSEGVNDAGYPTEPESSFQPTIEPVYACVYLDRPEAKHAVKASWYQIIPGEEDYLIDEATLEHDDSGWLMFSLTPATPLPSGEYYVSIALDGEHVQKQPFEVK